MCRPAGATVPRGNRPHPQPESHLRNKEIDEVNQDQIWSQVQEELRFQLAKRTYDMWLKNTSVISADGTTFRIGVPSKLAKDWLEDRFSGLIQETLQAVTGSEVDIDFVIAPTGHRPPVVTVDVDTMSVAPDSGRDNEVEPFPDGP